MRSPAPRVEAYLWKIGLRFEAGDQIYLNNGTHADGLKLQFGPIIKF